MILYIHSHEMADRGVAMGRHRSARDVVHIIVPDGTTVPDIVRMVEEQVADAGSIWTLVLNSHGDDCRSGSFYIGRWIGIPEVRQFAPLARYMNRRGYGVDVQACRVASNPAMVRELCTAFGVRVIAGTESQLGPGRLGTEGDRAGRHEGPTITATPDGGMTDTFWRDGAPGTDIPYSCEPRPGFRREAPSLEELGGMLLGS